MMKFAALAVLAVLACGCAAPAHNYAGSAGSVYDAAREPAHTFPPSTYNPEGPPRPLTEAERQAAAKPAS